MTLSASLPERARRRLSLGSSGSRDSCSAGGEGATGLVRLASDIRQAEVLEEGEYAMRLTWKELRFVDPKIETAYWDTLLDTMYLRFVALTSMWSLGFCGLVFLWPVFVPNGFSYKLALTFNSIMMALTGSAAVFIFVCRGRETVRRSWHGISACLLCIATVWLDLIALRKGISGLCSPLLYVAGFCLIAQLCSAGFRVPFRWSVAIMSFSFAIYVAEIATSAEVRAAEATWIADVSMVLFLSTNIFSGWESEHQQRLHFRRHTLQQRAVRNEARRNEELEAEVRRLQEQIAGSHKPAVSIVSPYELALERLKSLKQRAADEGRDADIEAVRELESILATHTSLYAPSLAQGDLPDVPSMGVLADWMSMEVHVSLRPGLRSRRNSRAELAGLESLSLRTQSLPPSRSLLFEEEQEASVAMSAVREWRFSAIALARATRGRPLTRLAAHVLEAEGLVEALGLDRARLARFLSSVEDGYHQVAYHNRVHAADVLQAAYYLLATPAIADVLSPLDTLAVLLAAIVHDLGHEGRNNTFEIATGSDRALVWNDRSVLENYHVSRCFLLLRDERCDFIRNFSPADRRYLRKSVIACVLATDIANHFEHLGVFRARASQPDFGEAEGDRQALINIIIKCADISNAVRPTGYYLRWAKRVVEEFFAQGDEERTRNLAISPWMDRNQPQVPAAQIGFIEFLVQPLFSALATQYPTHASLLDHGERNLQYWKGVRDPNPATNPAMFDGPPEAGVPPSPAAGAPLRTIPECPPSPQGSEAGSSPPLVSLSPPGPAPAPAADLPPAPAGASLPHGRALSPPAERREQSSPLLDLVFPEGGQGGSDSPRALRGPPGPAG